MGLGFFVLSFFLLLNLWQIRDYTDRKEVRTWIGNYIADGWYRKGGLHIVFATAKACLAVTLVFAIMYMISQQGDYDVPDPIVFGTVFCICASVIAVIYIIAVVIIRSAEAAFVQYVSQNVNYTSTIILKRVIKSKVELATAIVILLFMPVLYNWGQSLMSKSSQGIPYIILRTNWWRVVLRCVVCSSNRLE
jgi:hypothetical protein